MAGDPASKRSPSPGIDPDVLEGYLRAPSHMVAEVIDGELSLSPRPPPRCLLTTTRLAGRIDHACEQEGFEALVEPELHLGPSPDIIVPDLAGWRRDRWPTDPDIATITVAPDWVCEVVSTRTRALDRGKKRRVYRREGVRHYWIADPRIQILEVYRLDNGRWNELDTYEGDVKVRAEPFESMELDLARLWRW